MSSRPRASPSFCSNRRRVPPEPGASRPVPPRTIQGNPKVARSGRPNESGRRPTHRGRLMSLVDYLFGRALATDEEGEQRVGVWAGIPMLGLDALGSAAYGPEAALTLLIPLGAVGVGYIGPISTLIIILLSVVYVSYRQTIAAYPHGGGSYTVARENLGTNAGLIAAAALMLDYVLVVAVGISAGIGAPGLGLVNPPALHPLALPGHPPLHHPREPPGSPRVGRGVRGADLSVHRLAAGRDRHRGGQVDHGRRPSRAGRSPAGRSPRRRRSATFWLLMRVISPAAARR